MAVELGDTVGSSADAAVGLVSGPVQRSLASVRSRAIASGDMYIVRVTAELGESGGTQLGLLSVVYLCGEEWLLLERRQAGDGIGRRLRHHILPMHHRQGVQHRLPYAGGGDRGRGAGGADGKLAAYHCKGIETSVESVNNARGEYQERHRQCERPRSTVLHRPQPEHLGYIVPRDEPKGEALWLLQVYRCETRLQDGLTARSWGSIINV